MKKEHESLIRKDGFQTLLASLVCILGGLIVGYVVLLIIEPSGAFEAIVAVMKSFLRFPGALKLKYLRSRRWCARRRCCCAPCPSCLPTRWACSTSARRVSTAPVPAPRCMPRWRGIVPWYVCILLAYAGGARCWACWRVRCGRCCNVNEVISGIMLNWITLYLTNLLLGTVKDPTSPYTKTLPVHQPRRAHAPVWDWESSSTTNK